MRCRRHKQSDENVMKIRKDVVRKKNIEIIPADTKIIKNE